MNEIGSVKVAPRKHSTLEQPAVTITMVWCKLQFIGFHYWKAAEGPMAFLRHTHRHVFHIKAAKRVRGDDREIEFITMKRSIQEYVDSKYTDKTFDSSCEMIAADILEKFKMNEVTVSEDGENGATVYAL